jgi:pimeloyl-ACP methyl ester carboxylesterase
MRRNEGMTMANLLLVHGGLWEEGMDAARFWRQPGIVAGLERRGFDVFAPDRLYQAPDWATEASHLAQAIPDPPLTVLAGSNGCSAAARLAVDFPGSVTRLLLAWPATAGDLAIDTKERAHLTRLGATPEVIDALLAAQTLRGLANGELASLTLPVGVLRSAPANRFHQWETADALLRLLPQAADLPGCPEPPRPAFPPYLEPFLDAVAAFAAT